MQQRRNDRRRCAPGLSLSSPDDSESGGSGVPSSPLPGAVRAACRRTCRAVPCACRARGLCVSRRLLRVRFVCSGCGRPVSPGRDDRADHLASDLAEQPALALPVAFAIAAAAAARHRRVVRRIAAVLAAAAAPACEARRRTDHRLPPLAAPEQRRCAVAVERAALGQRGRALLGCDRRRLRGARESEQSFPSAGGAIARVRYSGLRPSRLPCAGRSVHPTCRTLIRSRLDQCAQDTDRTEIESSLRLLRAVHGGCATAHSDRVCRFTRHIGAWGNGSSASLRSH